MERLFVLLRSPGSTTDQGYAVLIVTDSPLANFNICLRLVKLQVDV